MIDDELLQELLSKASGLYNNGEYRSAIEAWKEALRVDPGSQKAREGIQMSTLLLGEGAPDVVVEPEPAPPAESAPRDLTGLSRAELDTLLDQGISRVRTLLDERRYSEAVAGARSLVPINPDSEEVQRLVEEAQEAFEAAPFIEEHLTLARELASQDRFEEAESECRKVFALDRANPDAHTLIAELRRRARLRRPAEGAADPADAGGRTVKMDLAEVRAQPPPESGEPQPAKEESLADPLPSDMFDFDLDLGAGERAPEESAPAEPSPAEAAPEALGTDGIEATDPSPVQVEPEAEVETVDADTVVPPSVRLVPRTEGSPPDAESWFTRLDESEPSPPARGAAGEEAPPLETGGGPGAGASSWEKELESLNLQSGEHDILGRSAARTRTASPAEVDSDLSSLLEDDPGAQPVSPGLPEDRPQAPPPRLRSEDGPRVEARGRPSRRERMEAAPPPETGSPKVAPVYFGLLGVVLLAAGGAAWWFFFQPRTATGSVPSAVTPPSASSGEKPEPEPGPIPTPIGSTSKEPVQPSPARSEGSAAALGAAATAHETVPPPAPPAAAAPAPPPRPKTPGEVRDEVAHHMAEGRRFLAASQWREARDEFAAILALDPVNFQAKELLDQAQERFNEETKVHQELDGAKRAFEEKDYQGALWKLYRLPRDPRLGDLDLRIRNAWFNWGVLGLKGGDAINASQKLAEALSTDPNDAEAAKVQEVAERYASKPKDKPFYSYVDTLKYRAFDQK